MLLIPLFFQVAAAPAVLPATPDVEATVVETSITVTSDAPMPVAAAGNSSRSRMTMHGGRARIDNIEGTSPRIPSASPHTYSLVQNSGLSVFVVDSLKKEYSRLDLDKLKETMGGAMAMLGQLRMEVRDSKFQVDSLGAGEAILGYSTQRWRLVHSMTIATFVGTDTLTMSMESRTDALYAPDFDALTAAPVPIQDSVGKLMAFEHLLTADIMKAMMDAAAKMPKGMPIRSVATNAMMSGMFDFTMTTTTEVSKVEKVRRPESFFEVPKGYKQVEFDLTALQPPAQ